MFPLRDDNPTLRTSLATFLLVGLNVVVWVLVQGLGREPMLTQSVWKFGAITGELLGRVAPGTSVPAGQGLVAVLDGTPNWWTVLTSMFMHGSWMHIVGNMWFLLVFGDNVEDAMGFFQFLVFYVLCGIAAVFAQAVSDPGSTIPMVGASGAIGGVMGGYFLLHPRAPVHMLVWFGFYVTRIVVPASFMLGYWFVIQLISGAFSGGPGGGVAFWAHVGGFVAGLLLVYPFSFGQGIRDERARRRSSMRGM